ncbi:MAG: aminopeptidase P family protein [Prevotella sp.]|nr:aminopeptidase P family protein [Prevotella sp.]
MSNPVNDRLALLREEMRREHLSAFVFPSTDPHHSEYTPDRWKGRQWISGFGGSAGTAVVTLTSAALWTDSRYFIAAAQELKGTEYQLMRERISGTPTIAEWLGAELRDLPDKEVGIDGWCSAHNVVEGLREALRKQGGLTLRTNFDPLERIWRDRPGVPLTPVEVQPMQYAGEDTTQKLARIRRALRAQHADGMLVTALDDIAWTLNLRGSDVHCNPVFVSYLLITTQTATLFVDPRKLEDEAVKRQLAQSGVATAGYGDIADALRRYPEYNILMDGDEVNDILYNKVQAPETVNAASPIPALKAVKNEQEIAGMRAAHVRDGIAMVRFLHWLKPAVQAGGQTELTVSAELERQRARQPLYRGLSFDTIAGYEANGAIVHYEPTPATDAPLRPEGLLLIDSGAQYQDGTTDITRTIALGPVTDEQRRVYTLVLKGHIQLSMAKFPSGSSGTQLDVLARQPMWREALNYLHGTGHGVGSYLNVHEGPHQIRMNYVAAPLTAGMVVTDEPGLYLEGRFGVRTENILLIRPYREGEYGPFLQFEPLTLCPIDTVPIDIALLTDEELAWLNDYHATVLRALAPHLSGSDLAWLQTATQPQNR